MTEHPPASANLALRVLVVAHSFPPMAVMGTMRTLRLVRYLAQSGCETTVLASHPSTYWPETPVDQALSERVPLSVRIIRVRAWRWATMLKTWIRRRLRAGSGRRPKGAQNGGNQVARPVPPRLPPVLARLKWLMDGATGVPDRENAWFVPAILRALFACGRPDVIYSSSPPWTGQLVALALASFWRCPWVADFRDPWSRAPWREDRPPFVMRVNGWLERRVVRRADAVLFATRGNAADFARHYGEPLSNKFVFIENGCDVEEFEGVSPRPATGRFVLLHAGSLYGARNPVPLLRAVARAIETGRLARERFQVRLLGELVPDGDDPLRVRQELGLEGVVDVTPTVSRAESLAEMLGASALLLIQPRTTLSVPGKLYEYLAAGRPILALADEGETADIVRRTGAGLVVGPADERQIEEALVALVNGGARVRRAEPASYDGRVQAAQASEVLRRVAKGQPGVPAIVAHTQAGARELLDPGVKRGVER